MSELWTSWETHHVMLWVCHISGGGGGGEFSKFSTTKKIGVRNFSHKKEGVGKIVGV